MARLISEKTPVVGRLVKWHEETQELKRFKKLSPADQDREVSKRVMSSRVKELGAAFGKLGLKGDIDYKLLDLSQFPEATQGKVNAERVVGHGVVVTKDIVNKIDALGRRLENRKDKEKQEIEKLFAMVFANFIEKTIIKPFIARGEVFPGNDENNPTLITVQMSDSQLEKFIEVFPYGDRRDKAIDILLGMMINDHPPQGKRKEVLIYIYISNVKNGNKDIYQSTIIVSPARMSPGEEELSLVTRRTDLQKTMVNNPNEAFALNDNIQERAGRLVKPQKPSHLHHVRVLFD